MSDERNKGTQGLPNRASEGSVDQSIQRDQASTGEATQVQSPSLPSPSIPVVPASPSLATPTLARERWLEEDRTITKFRWENVKTLKGKNLHDAKKYLADRDGKECAECGLESQDEQSFDAHHIDGNRENNKRWNLFLADHPCNARLNGNLRANQMRYRMSSLVYPVVSARENAVAVDSVAVGSEAEGLGDEVIEAAIASGVTPVPVGTRPWSSREGEKSERMRSSFNTWIRDPVNGPFAGLDGEAPAISLAALGRIAIHAIGFGSSQCYSSDTYVLTEYGYRLHSEWEGERIAVYDPVHDKMFLEKPLDFVAEDYTGPMIHFVAHSTDILVTPNHRMLAATSATFAPKAYARKAPSIKQIRPTLLREDNHRQRTYWRIVDAADLANYKYWKFRVASNGWCGEENPPPLQIVKNLSSGRYAQKQLVSIPTELLVQVIGYYVSEGSHSSHKSMRICQHANSPVVTRIEETLRKLPFGVSKHISTANGSQIVNFVVYGKPFYDWIVTYCGDGAYGKRLPTEVKNLGCKYLSVLLKAMMEGDGSWNHTQKSGYYLTASKQLALDFIEVATKLGYAAYMDVIYVPPRKSAHFNTARGSYLNRIYLNIMRQTRTMSPPRCRTNRVEIMPYAGKVYCFSTSTGFYVTLRNGRPAIQGNTYERYCLEDSYGKKLGEPGILEVFFDEKGRKMVRFRGPKMLGSVGNKEQQKIDA